MSNQETCSRENCPANSVGRFRYRHITDYRTACCGSPILEEGPLCQACLNEMTESKQYLIYARDKGEIEEKRVDKVKVPMSTGALAAVLVAITVGLAITCGVIRAMLTP